MDPQLYAYLLFFQCICILKIVNLSWNLVPRLIQICRNQWWCSLFLFYCFNIVSNDHGRIHSCDFFVFDWIYPFGANLIQKIKIVSLNWKLVRKLIWICRIQWWYSFFCFRLETLFFGKLGPKNLNCKFKLKYDT